MNYRIFVAFVALVCYGCACVPTPPTPEARSALTPAGTLRVAILLTTALQVTKQASPGELKGVSIDLGKALAHRMGIPFTPVPYNSIVPLMEGAGTGQWDIAFLAIDRSRDKDLDYAAPFMEVEIGYLVPAGSPINGLADVDRAGIRVAVSGTGGTDLLLTRILKHAQLVRGTGIGALTEALKTGKADAAAANKPTLFADSEQLPGSRVLEGRIGTVQYAIATRKGQDAGNAYVRKFIEEARAEGLIKAAIDNAGLRGVVVAAPR